MNDIYVEITVMGPLPKCVCANFVTNACLFLPGRHCDNHQMTGNYMWDEVSKAEFLIGTNPDSKLPLWWNGSEPIWVTLQKLGKKVFMYFWPGKLYIFTILFFVATSEQLQSLIDQF